MRRIMAGILLTTMLLAAGCAGQPPASGGQESQTATSAAQPETAARPSETVPDREVIAGTGKILNGAYGAHERNTFDLYMAQTDRPAPLVIYIHGGGFVSGSKEQLSEADRQRCLDNGISFASINYPFFMHKPLQDILKDIARAVQYFRYMAAEYHIDPDRISCYGESAGAGASLFLAAKPDMADPDSSDPVLRQSTRLFAAGLYETQSTYDFYQWPELLGIPMEAGLILQQRLGLPLSLLYGTPADGAADYESGEIAVIREFLDMTADLSPDDCPLYIRSTVAADNAVDILHAQVYSRTVYQVCRQNGIEAELSTPEQPCVVPDFLSFLLERLDA